MKFIQKVNFPKTLKFWYKFLKAFSIQLNWYFFFSLNIYYLQNSFHYGTSSTTISALVKTN